MPLYNTHQKVLFKAAFTWFIKNRKTLLVHCCSVIIIICGAAVYDTHEAGTSMIRILKQLTKILSSVSSVLHLGCVKYHEETDVFY